MEVVSGKWRTIIPVLYQLPFGFGNAVLALLAYWLRDWRKLEFALATISSLYLLYWFWVPESPRWLLATGETEKAIDVLENIARENKMNTREISDLSEYSAKPEARVGDLSGDIARVLTRVHERVKLNICARLTEKYTP
ncbi:unnamed protein product, partial [Iphiclides podalirius]